MMLSVLSNDKESVHHDFLSPQIDSLATGPVAGPRGQLRDTEGDVYQWTDQNGNIFYLHTNIHTLYMIIKLNTFKLNLYIFYIGD